MLKCAQCLNLPAVKAGWGIGPWQDEPDIDEFIHAERRCILHRCIISGAWLGYCAVSESHPYYLAAPTMVQYYERKLRIPPSLRVHTVHGGLTISLDADQFSHSSAKEIIKRNRWLGFDCTHAKDLTPEKVRLHDVYGLAPPDYTQQTYKTYSYARKEITKLAKVLTYAESRIKRRSLISLVAKILSPLCKLTPTGV